MVDSGTHHTDDGRRVDGGHGGGRGHRARGVSSPPRAPRHSAAPPPLTRESVQTVASTPPANVNYTEFTTIVLSYTSTTR